MGGPSFCYYKKYIHYSHGQCVPGMRCTGTLQPEGSGGVSV